MRDVDGVLLWAVRLDGIDDQTALPRYLACLSTDEERERERFATAALKKEYAVTRALCRLALTHDCRDAVAPSRWTFGRSDAGKPYVLGPDVTHAPNFSLSNAEGIVICAVSVADVGVDVEPTNRRGLLPIADDIFSEDERAVLGACKTDGDRERRAVELWTQKEAYLKANGVGIATRLRKVSPLAEETQREWQIEVVSSDAHRDFVIALAVRRSDGGARRRVTVNDSADSLFHSLS